MRCACLLTVRLAAGVQDRSEAGRRGFYDGEQLELVCNGQPLRLGNRKGAAPETDSAKWTAHDRDTNKGGCGAAAAS